MSDAVEYKIKSQREIMIDKYRQMTEAARAEGADQITHLYRRLAKEDLFFLLIYVLRCDFANNDWVYERCREFERDPNGYLDIWPREHFKDLPLDTPMLTQNRGWTTHGDLVPGDMVFAPSGKPVQVLALSPRYHMNRCLKITFQDGKEMVCGEGHLWRVRNRYRGRRDENGQRPSLRRERIVEARDLKVGDDVGAIEGAVEFPERDLPIHPYVLGAWLGDGHRASPRITCSYEDIDIPAMIQSLGYEVKEQKSRDGRTGVYAFGGGVRGKKGTGVYPILRRLGVTKEKHIPDMYKMASVEQRIALMAGLMDTDGSCNENGNATFTNSSELLARDVYELAVGLALRPRIHFYWTTCNREGKFPMWVVSFQAHRDRNPFMLYRKWRKAIDPSIHRECRKVVSVVEVDPVDTSCIQVEGGMYLAGRDLIPTHNSTVITLAAVIQKVLQNPEVTILILSYNRPNAKTFLRAIKTQFELNDTLKELFPDIFYADPQKESPKWSEDDGIRVKRRTMPKEETIEASGLVDGMPTGKHFGVMVYDDVVEQRSISSPEMIEKTTDAWSLSLNLTKEGGVIWMVGTIYHFADTYSAILKRGAAKPRIYAATKDGTFKGEPVLWTRERLAEKIQKMGPYVASCQLFGKPIAEGEQVFLPEWLQTWNRQKFGGMNIYIVGDPANEKKKKSDYTVFWVIGLGADKNYYIIDGVRDKLNMKERADTLFQLHAQYHPKRVGYEKYGMQSDIEYMKERMKSEQYNFQIYELGGTESKEDRIKKLQPLFNDGRIFLPEKLVKRDYQKKLYDITQSFINDEYLQFPFMTHDDMLDCMARIVDPKLGATFPRDPYNQESNQAVAKRQKGSYDYDTYGYLGA